MRCARDAAILIVVAVTQPALAGAESSFEHKRAWQLAVDAGVGIARSESNPFSPGPALTLHGGYQFASGFVPDLALGFAQWSDGGFSEYAMTLMPGVRWHSATGRILTGACAHVGFGHIGASVDGNPIAANGLAFELGVDLAFVVAPRIAVGPHFSVNKVVVSNTGNIEIGELWLQFALAVHVNL